MDGQTNDCLTTLSLTVFTQRNFVADFLQGKCDFTRKRVVSCFSPPPPLSGLVAMYDDHLRLIGKRTNYSFSQKTRLNVLSYGIKIWTNLSTVLLQCTRVTDGRTDRILIARPRLHSMQRSKNRSKAFVTRVFCCQKKTELFIS